MRSSSHAINITYREAEAVDNSDIAQLICLAGGGIYEFLFDEFIPFLSAVDILSMGIAGEGSPLSFHNCYLAVNEADNEIVGGANAFPANHLKDQSYWMLPAERQQYVQSFLQCQNWGSIFLNALAVRTEYSGRGIGARLLNWAQWRAATAGFDRLSLHVWADNIGAHRFYEARGFVELSSVEIPAHPRLAHTGGSILMSRTVAPVQGGSTP